MNNRLMKNSRTQFDHDNGEFIFPTGVEISLLKHSFGSAGINSYPLTMPAGLPHPRACDRERAPRFISRSRAAVGIFAAIAAIFRSLTSVWQSGYDALIVSAPEAVWTAPIYAGSPARFVAAEAQISRLINPRRTQ